MFQENIKAAEPQTDNLQMLHFGEDYRLFINSLSDSSVTNQSRHRNKKLRRKNKRREVRRDSLSTLSWTDSTFQAEECFPYESQSEAEVEDMFLLVSASQRQIHGLEGRVADFLSLGFASSANSREYVSDGLLYKSDHSEIV